MPEETQRELDRKIKKLKRVYGKLGKLNTTGGGKRQLDYKTLTMCKSALKMSQGEISINNHVCNALKTMATDMLATGYMSGAKNTAKLEAIKSAKSGAVVAKRVLQLRTTFRQYAKSKMKTVDYIFNGLTS